MSQPSNRPEASPPAPVAGQSAEHEAIELTETQSAANQPQPSYVRLAMRNMVRKGRKSLFHFALTTLGLLTLLVGLAYITR